MPFADDLARFGPDSAERLSPSQSRDYCAHLTATHYENFSVDTWLTPRDHRAAFQSIYAFCRWSDDLADEINDHARSLELLAWWRNQLREMFLGRTQHPVMVALASTVERYGIPIEPFEALISAFEQDQTVTDYDTYDQLLDYCRRSADPVGHLVLYVAGAFNAENARLSDLTCTALQLANFWQDVARDLAIGRVYLPREDRDRFGYPESDLHALKFTPSFRALLSFEVERTRSLLQRGRALLPRIPREFAVDIDLFSRGGLAILDLIEQHDFDVLSRRPSLSKWTKARLLGRALWGVSLTALRPANPANKRPHPPRLAQPDTAVVATHQEKSR
jgi:squalene synthase HpnC